MSRDALLRADTDTGKLSDPKVLALARRLRNPILTAAALMLHEAVYLASWREGERLALPDCLPGWWIGEDDELDRLVAALIAVRLLDADQRIPEHAFESWYSPVVARLMDRDRRSIFAGLRRQGMPVEQANREADKRVRHALRWQPKAQPKGDSLRPEPDAQPSASQPASQPTAEQDEQEEVRNAPVGSVLADPLGASFPELMKAYGLDRAALGANR